MLLETLLKILMGTVYKINLEIIIPFLIENFTFLTFLRGHFYIFKSAIHKYCSSSNGHLPSLYCDLKPQTCSAKYFEVNKNTVYSMPTMTFSFVCHTAVLPIYAELGGGEGQEKGTADFNI